MDDGNIELQGVATERYKLCEEVQLNKVVVGTRESEGFVNV